MQITENIKVFRTKQGLTQSDLAVLLSVSPQAVSRWENGQAFPDIALLPELAKYLCVSIDELMGYDGQRLRLREELHERLRAKPENGDAARENELRILDLFEELGRTDSVYLRGYFGRLMTDRRDPASLVGISEERVAAARRSIRERIRSSGIAESIELLYTVTRHEDEADLALWNDEYRLPESLRFDLRAALLLSRYAEERDVEGLHRQRQLLLFGHLRNAVSELTGAVAGQIADRFADLHGTECYRTALQTVDLYSTRIDDVMLLTRITAEVRYAEAQVRAGESESALQTLALAAEHLRVLAALPSGTVLTGSVPALDTVSLVLNSDVCHRECLMHVGGRAQKLFDGVREDARFIAYEEALQAFYPKENCRSFVLSEEEDSPMDPTWEALLEKARAEATPSTDGGAIALLTASGSIHTLTFRDSAAASDAEGAMKLFTALKRSGDSLVKRMVYVWKNGGLDLPSYAFRDCLLKVDPRNLSAEMLLQGLRSPIVKPVSVTVPKARQN